MRTDGKIKLLLIIINCFVDLLYECNAYLLKHYFHISGSYDHCLKVWDLRSQGSVLSMNHGFPVECVTIFPSGGICISAGQSIKVGSELKLYALLVNGHRLMEVSHLSLGSSFCSSFQASRLKQYKFSRIKGALKY